RDEPPGNAVAHVAVLARLQPRRVVGGEQVADQRAPLHPAAVRIGLDPLRAQPLHLGAALVALDHLLGRGPARAVALCAGRGGLWLLDGLLGALLDAHGGAGDRLAGPALVVLSVSL